jgi:hypothetical protein
VVGVSVSVSVPGVVCSGGDCEGRHGGGGGQGSAAQGKARKAHSHFCPAAACPVAPLWRRRGLGSKVTETRRGRKRERKHITYSKPLSSVYLPSVLVVVVSSQPSLARSLALRCTVVLDCGIITRPHPPRRHRGGAEPQYRFWCSTRTQSRRLVLHWQQRDACVGAWVRGCEWASRTWARDGAEDSERQYVVLSSW